MNTEKKLNYFFLLTIIIGFNATSIIEAAKAAAKKERWQKEKQRTTTEARINEIRDQLKYNQLNDMEKDMLRKELDELTILYNLLSQQLQNK